jgi:hypothetical protein
MKKLGIFLVIVLTLILATPNISFAERFSNSEHFDTFHSRSYHEHERYERHPYYHEHHERHPYYYGYYGSPYPYYYAPGPFIYGPSFGLNFGFVIK